MPYRSQAQQGWAHTPAAKAAGFPTAEFDAATKGMTGLPRRVPGGKAAKAEAIRRMFAKKKAL